MAGIYPSKFVKPNAYSFVNGAFTPNWEEFIGNKAPNSDEFADNYGNATLFAKVKADRKSMYDFINSVCGYHYTSGEFVSSGGTQKAVNRIRRVLPVQHPKNPNLWAKRISSINGTQFQGKTTVNPLDDPTIQPPPTTIGKFAKYGFNLVGVNFQPFKYKLLLDTNPDVNTSGSGPIDSGTVFREWRRYTEVDTKVNTYVGTVQTGQFKYAEGPNPPATTAFVGEVNFLETKLTFNLHWRRVPDDYVHDTVNYEIPYPVGIKACVGRVNVNTFMGFPAGTLLLLEPEIDRYAAGGLVSSFSTYDVAGTLGTKGNGQVPYMYCDVSFPIVHFDPKNFAGSSETNGKRGHNVKPWWPGGAPITYYFVTSDGTLTGATIYGSADFTQMFAHWSGS